jgi:hypothetical protein
VAQPMNRERSLGQYRHRSCSPWVTLLTFVRTTLSVPLDLYTRSTIKNSYQIVSMPLERHTDTSKHFLEIFMRCGDNLLGGVLDHDDLHPFGAALMYPYALGRRFREVDNATLAAPVRSTVVDFDDHMLLRPETGDLDLRPQR